MERNKLAANPVVLDRQQREYNSMREILRDYNIDDKSHTVSLAFDEHRGGYYGTVSVTASKKTNG